MSSSSGLACAAVGAVVLLVGCSSGSPASTTPASPAASTTPGVAGGNGAQRFPGVNGLVADVSGSTIQVQANNEQTTVTFSRTTTFTNSVKASASDLKPGRCVTVRSNPTGAQPSEQPGAAAATPVIAATVVISDPVAGACIGAGGAAGAGGFGGFGGTRTGGARPTRSPDGTFPTNRPPGGLGAFGGANGKVLSLTSGGFVVESRAFRAIGATGAAGGSAAPTPSAAPSVREVSVTTTKTTTYERIAKATASAVVAGSCVTALGTADDTGAVAARSISVRPAVAGSCDSGFVRRGTGVPGA